MDLYEQLRLRRDTRRAERAAQAAGYENDPNAGPSQIVVPINRRNVLAAMGGGVALMAAGVMAGCGSGSDDNQSFNGGGTINPSPNPSPSGGTSNGLTVDENNTLNFALNLEYLEAEFYSYATSGAGISAGLTTGQGTLGATTGGGPVPFSDSRLRDVAAELLADEVAHIQLLKSFLGAAAVAKPAINLNALGQGFANDVEFLTLARSFTDVGTSAYVGGSRFLTNRDVVETGARILATEGYHAGNIRYQVTVRNIRVTAVDDVDQVPVQDNFFATNEQSLAIARGAAAVVPIVRGGNPAGGRFFPNGLNGAIR